MKSNTIALSRPDNTTTTYRWIDIFSKKIFMSKFSRLSHDRIHIIEGEKEYVFGAGEDDSPLHATVIVHDASFYSDIIFGGTVGSGEAYMAGSWECDELTDLVRIILRNGHLLEMIDGGLGKMMLPVHKAFHFLHRNSLSGSRKNIGAHYDLGNDMFEQFLDPTMMYSSGIFDKDGMTMEMASIAKMDRICQKLQLNPDDHLLEIGTGWGGFAIYAAKNYGCRVTTTTISKQQYEYAESRIKQQGLEDRITLLCEDYRNIDGQYDKLVSIEMIEAVGHAYYRNYFERCSQLLKDDGLMLLQSITIADQRYQAASNEVDFIQRYIFPGGCLPSVSVIAQNVSDHTDMRFYQLEDIGQHYATTLAKWRERFFSNISKIKNMGYTETFIRMWDFYLSSCESAFIERAIGDVQMLIMRPGARPVTFAG